MLNEEVDIRESYESRITTNQSNLPGRQTGLLCLGSCLPTVGRLLLIFLLATCYFFYCRTLAKEA